MSIKTKLAAAFLAGSAFIGAITEETGNAFDRGAAASDSLNMGSQIIHGIKGTEPTLADKIMQPAASILLGFSGGAAETVLDKDDQFELKKLPLLATNIVAGIAGGLSVHFSDAAEGKSPAELAADFKAARAENPEISGIREYAQAVSFKHHMGL